MTLIITSHWEDVMVELTQRAILLTRERSKRKASQKM